jgi:hypothetical protein
MTFDQLFANVEKFVLPRFGFVAYLVRGEVGTFDRVPIALPDPIPDDWLSVNVLEEVAPGQPFGNQFSTETGGMGSNADEAPGERRDLRVFRVLGTQELFDAPPTDRDRLIVAATGENWAITKPGTLDIVGQTQITFLLTCRELT